MLRALTTLRGGGFTWWMLEPPKTQDDYFALCWLAMWVAAHTRAANEDVYIHGC